jgi:HD superfamily phosphohydrolase
VGSSRIIKMLDVIDDQLVVEEKGIYSIEKFIVARRLMYWQVYLHKTVLSAEFMLVNILKRAKHLRAKQQALFASPALDRFLVQDFTKTDFESDPSVLATFCNLDDFDILGAIKVWQNHPDPILSDLCQRLVQRNLFKIELRKEAFSNEEIQSKVDGAAEVFGLTPDEASYYVIQQSIENRAYRSDDSSIKIAFKDGRLVDVAAASDHLNLEALSETVEKHFIAYPKELRKA